MADIYDDLVGFGIDKPRLEAALDSNENWGRMVHAFEYITVLGVVLARWPESTSSLVEQLDAIDGGDPEKAHGAADGILLAAVPEAVSEAYERVQERCAWWAGA